MVTKKSKKGTSKKGTKRIKDLSAKNKGIQAGSFNSFVNFGDIKGESTDKDHKDWIEIR
jgi:hypothetical protein